MAMGAQLADAAKVKEAGYDHFYKTLRVLAQWDLLDEHPDRHFSANTATKELVRGKVGSLGPLFTSSLDTPSSLSNCRQDVKTASQPQ